MAGYGRGGVGNSAEPATVHGNGTGGGNGEIGYITVSLM